MLDHESQRLLRSAFITGSFDPLTALAMMVTEITEFHPYCISDVSHFYALFFHLVFTALTPPLYSLLTEYQISSFNYSFMKGFPTLSNRHSLHQGGKTTKQPTNQENRKAPNSQETPRLGHGDLSCPRAGFTGSAMVKPAADSKPGLRYILSIDPQWPYAASLSGSSIWSQGQERFQTYLGISHLLEASPTSLPARSIKNTDVVFVNSALEKWQKQH